MHDFFNFTANDQHDHHHGHGTVVTDVDTDDGNSSNPDSTHDDEERNHHNQEKEQTDMNRTIRNSNAPILTGFALSLMFILCSTLNAADLDKVDFNVDNLDRVTITADFRIDNLDLDQDARSYQDDAFIRFSNDENFNSDAQDFARADADNFIDFGDYDFVDVDNVDFTRSDADAILDDNNNPAEINVENYFRFDDINFISFDNDRFGDLGNSDIDVINELQIARVDRDDVYSFDAYDFSRNDLVA